MLSRTGEQYTYLYINYKKRWEVARWIHRGKFHKSSNMINFLLGQVNINTKWIICCIIWSKLFLLVPTKQQWYSLVRSWLHISSSSWWKSGDVIWDKSQKKTRPDENLYVPKIIFTSHSECTRINSWPAITHFLYCWAEWNLRTP